MQESRKASATASGGSPKLTAEQADELAASFRPAWDVEDDALKSDPAGADEPTNIVAVPTVRPSEASLAPLAESSREAIASANVLEVASAPAPAVALAPPPPARQSGFPTTAPFGPRIPTPMPAAIATGAGLSTDELNALVPRKSSKGYLFVAIGIGIAVGLGALLKFALSDDAPATPAALSQPASKPATPTNEIPPPPPPTEAATAKAAETNPVAAEPKAGAADNVTSKPVVAEHHETTPKPFERRDTMLKAAAPEPRAAAARPEPRPMPRPAPAPAPAPPKTPPKPAGGAIVRDNPF